MVLALDKALHAKMNRLGGFLLSVGNHEVKFIRFFSSFVILGYQQDTYKFMPAFSNCSAMNLCIFIALAFRYTNMFILPFLPVFHQY